MEKTPTDCASGFFLTSQNTTFIIFNINFEFFSKHRRTINLKKCICLLIALLCCTALLLTQVSEIARASSGTDENLTFSSFEQLKTHAANSYEELTSLKYTGKDPLVIQENLQLPDFLCLDLGTSQLTVPAGVEFSASSWDYTSSIYAGTVLVKGTLTCDYLEVSDALTVEGSVKNNNVIYLDSTTKVTGSDKIIGAQDWSIVSCWYNITNMADLKKAVSDVSNSTDPAWQHHLNISQKNLLIDASVVIPEGCQLYIDSSESPVTITIAEGCTLELRCPTWVYAPVVIEGILNNCNSMNIFYGEGGRIILCEGGLYLSQGSIFAHSNKNTALSDILYGFDLSAFNVSTYQDTPYCRQLDSKCQHRLESFVPTVTPPTCNSGGFTTNTCPDCGDSYISNATAATGLHTYTDAKDADCNVCGTKRDIEPEIKTAPLYRLYNIYTLEHLFTANAEERDMLARAGWIYEGIAWYIPSSGDPVYRLYNPYDDSHFYTLSTEEIDTLLPLGWKLDGIMCYSAPSGETRAPIYRLFNPYELKNYHHYTISKDECDMLVPLGWILEGVAWYGMLN